MVNVHAIVKMCNLANRHESCDNIVLLTCIITVVILYLFHVSIVYEDCMYSAGSCFAE